MKLLPIVVTAVLTLGLGLSACEKKPQTPIEKLEDNIKDGLNARPNEKMQDAVEDAADAVKEAGEAVEEAVTPPPK